MSESGQNYILGSWCNGHTSVENINPFNVGDGIEHYAGLDRAKLATGLEAPQTILISIDNELIDRRIELGNLPSAGAGYHVTFGVRENSSCRLRQKVGYAEKLYTMVKTSFVAAGSAE